MSRRGASASREDGMKAAVPMAASTARATLRAKNELQPKNSSRMPEPSRPITAPPPAMPTHTPTARARSSAGNEVVMIDSVTGMTAADEGRRRVTGLVRAAASEPQAARLVRERVTRELLVPIAEQVGGDQPELRASLLASQIVGLVMARLIVAVEPLASAAPAELAGALGPVLQHYLTGRLDQRGGEAGGTIEH